MTKLDLRYWNGDTQQWEASLAQGTDLEALETKVEQFETRVDGELDGIVDFVNTEILTDSTKQVYLNHGPNSVNTKHASPSEVKLYGRTLTNLLGSKGSGTDTSVFNITNLITVGSSGDGAVRLTCAGEYPVAGINLDSIIQPDKFYVFGVRNRGKSNRFKIGVDDVASGGSVHTLWNGIYGKGKTFKTNEWDWETQFFPFPGTRSRIGIAANHGAVDNIDFIDIKNMAVYEIDEVTYNELLTLTDPVAYDNKFPFVNDTKNLNQPYIISESRNLLPINDNAAFNSFGSGAGAQYDNKWVNGVMNIYNGSTSVIGKGIKVQSKPNTRHYFELKNAGGAPLWVVVNGVSFPYVGALLSHTFITADDGYIKLNFIIAGPSSLTAPARVTDVLLTITDDPVPYVEQSSSEFYADVELAQVGDVRDVLVKNDDKWNLIQMVNKTTTPYTVLGNAVITDVSNKIIGDINVGPSTLLTVGSGFDIVANADGTKKITLLEDKSLAKANRTLNVINAELTYKSNLAGIVDGSVQEQSHIRKEVDLHTQSIIDLYVKIKALEV